MPRKISPERVAELEAYAREKVPDLEIIYKDEPLPTLWIKFVFLMVSFVGLFSKKFEADWYSRISNAMSPKYILFPTREHYSDLSDYNTYMIFRHELVHLQDMRERGIWFTLSYVLFPLPLFRTGRAHWEFRGYAQNLIVRFEETGVIPDRTLDWVADQYTGGLYFLMWTNRSYVDTKLRMLRDDIYAGKVQGYHPDLTWWKKDRSLK